MGRVRRRHPDRVNHPERVMDRARPGGTVADHWIENDREKSFLVDDKVLRMRDTYGVAVVPGQNDAFALAVTVRIDHLTERDHRPPGSGRRGRPRRRPWRPYRSRRPSRSRRRLVVDAGVDLE